MKKIKICIISPFGYPLYNKNCKKKFGGGAAVQLYLLSKEFAKSNLFDIEVITGKYIEKQPKIETFNNIKLYSVLPIKGTIYNYFKAIFIFFYYLLIINPDVIIQRVADATTGLCAFFSKIHKKRFIFSIGIDTDVNGISEKGIKGKIYSFGLESADLIIAQNKDQVVLLRNAKPDKLHNIKIIRSGYEISNKKTGIKNYILWVGRAVNWKRPEMFLELSKKFPNENFYMICYLENDFDYWNNLKKRSLRINNLKFVPFVPFHKIDQIFQNAKLLINTSYYEGFPNAFIQAFKNSIPVVSMNVNPDNILEKFKVGFFCNDNFNELISSIKTLIREKKLYDSFCKRAFLYAKNNHDIEIIGNLWLDLIVKFTQE